MHIAAEYIPNNVPAIPEDYDRVCVHGVRVSGGRRELAEDSAAHVWCVYGGLKDSPAVECFGEFASKSEAWQYALDVFFLFECPIWDCKKAERDAAEHRHTCDICGVNLRCNNNQCKAPDDPRTWSCGAH